MWSHCGDLSVWGVVWFGDISIYCLLVSIKARLGTLHQALSVLFDYRLRVVPFLGDWTRLHSTHAEGHAVYVGLLKTWLHLKW